MKPYSITALIIVLFSSCWDFGLDAHEEHMKNKCKCEDFGSSISNFYIEDKEGSVQACGRQSGDSLKWGFIIDNNACDPYLPFIYDDAQGFSFGLAPVKLKGRWGAIDHTGKVVLGMKYKRLTHFSDSLAAFQTENESWGFINTRGDTILEANFSEVNDFWGNLSFVFHPQKGWQIYNSKGKRLPIQIDSLVENFQINNAMLAISHGHIKDGSVYNEVIEYPFYTKGQKVKLIGFRNRYAILPYSVNTNLTETEKLFTTEKTHPIFQ